MSGQIRSEQLVSPPPPPPVGGQTVSVCSAVRPHCRTASRALSVAIGKETPGRRCDDATINRRVTCPTAAVAAHAAATPPRVASATRAAPGTSPPHYPAPRPPRSDTIGLARHRVGPKHHYWRDGDCAKPVASAAAGPGNTLQLLF